MECILQNFHHIGYLVKNMDKSIYVMELMGFSIKKEKCFDPDRKVYICFLDGNGIIYELIEPLKDSSIYPLLKKFRNVPYHVCYEVKDMKHAIQKMQQIGFVITNEPARALAISENARVTFMAHVGMGIVEILEEED